MAWEKYADEVKIFPANWSEILDGDVVSTVEVDVSGDLTCTVEHLEESEGLSTIKISGGVARESGFVVVTITTAGGQTLTPQQALTIIDRPVV